MRKLIETVLEDISTREIFLFRVACDSCGQEYGNRPTRFTKASVEVPDPGKQIIFDALYEQERRDARNTAIRSAAEHMNYCPICKRLVCNRCFLICEDLDMCKECAAALQQSGQPVVPPIVEQAINW